MRTESQDDIRTGTNMRTESQDHRHRFRLIKQTGMAEVGENKVEN